MSYTVSLSENEKYIICCVSGEMDIDIAKQFTIDMNELSHETRIKRFLVDVRKAPNVSDMFDNYKFAYKDMNELDLQRDVRSAILVSTGDKSHDFVGIVSRNAGYNVRVFDNGQAAIAWLDEEIPG